jgi:hypothetical protein
VLDQLPPRPDFEALAAAAPASADRRTLVLALIGNLIVNWSNNESLFIYVLMILLDTDRSSAAIVFATLNTTRARLDLIHRLSKIRIRDEKLDKALTKLIDRFNRSTALRNEFNHCMYITDDAGQITHTQSMRIVENHGRGRKRNDEHQPRYLGVFAETSASSAVEAAVIAARGQVAKNPRLLRTGYLRTSKESRDLPFVYLVQVYPMSEPKFAVPSKKR